MSDGIKVLAADTLYRAPREQRLQWAALNIMLAAAIRNVGIETAYSLFLSAVSQHMRVEIGVEAAQAVLRGFADTMPEAARIAGGDL